MIVETVATVAKNIANEISKVAIEKAKACIEQLPDKIGELSDVESLPEKIDLLPEDSWPICGPERKDIQVSETVKPYVDNTQYDSEHQSPENQELSEKIDSEMSNDLDLEADKPDIQYIETNSERPLFEQNRLSEQNTNSKFDNNSDTNENKRGGLSEDEKTKVREKHPDWPDEIIDAIGSWEEYEIYDNANLVLEYINGRPCLIRTDIDMEQKDVKGRTNRERMELGLAPLDKNGKPIELHHIGQKADSPLVELTFEEHHCNGNDTKLHDKNKETEVHGEGNNWKDEREKHWENRSSHE